VQDLTLAGLVLWPPFLLAGHRCPARCHLPARSASRINTGLLGVAARRDCPFHPTPEAALPVPPGLRLARLIDSSLLLW